MARPLPAGVAELAAALVDAVATVVVAAVAALSGLRRSKQARQPLGHPAVRSVID